MTTALPPGFVLDAPRRPLEITVTPRREDEPDGAQANALPEGFVLDAPQPLSAEVASPGSGSNPGRALQIGVQGVGRSYADLIGMPFDLSNMLVDTIMGGVDRASQFVGGPEIPFRFGRVSIGDTVADAVGSVAEAAGMDLIDPDSLEGRERLAYNVNRFGAEAATGGVGLARAAARRFAEGMAATPRMGDSFLRPYVDNPGRALRGDVAGGAGAGAGLTWSEENDMGPAGDVLAMLIGGYGGTSALGAIEGAPRAARNVKERLTPDTNIPVDPETGQPVSQRTTRRAATIAQRTASDAEKAAQTIEQRIMDAHSAGNPVATSGLLSDDVGLISAEQSVRLRNRVPFIERDRQLMDTASRRVDDLRDEGADMGAVGRSAEQTRTDRLEPFNQRVAQSEADRIAAEQALTAQGAQLAPVANAEARASASGRLHEAVVEPYKEARSAKNQAFDALDPQRVTQVDASGVTEAAQRVREGINQLGPQRDQLPAEFVQAIERLAPDIQTQNSAILDEFGAPFRRDVNVGGPGTAALGDLVDVRKYLSTAHENAVRSGNFTLADNISTLRKAINETVERTPAAAEANRQYSAFADRYRPGPADEGAKFTREVDRRREPAPSATAGRFLSSPEKAQALKRMLDGSPEGTAAAREYLRSDFASAALKADGTVDPARARSWLDRNADVMAEFPQFRQEFERTASEAANRSGVVSTARTTEKQARLSLQEAERGVDRSIVGDLLREDPRNVANNMLSGRDFASADRMREVTDAIGANPDAARGWRAAVSEVLSRKVRNAGGAISDGGTEGPVSIAKLRQVWNDHEDALRGVYSPDDMNTLRDVHKMLAPLENRRIQASVGSPTAENQALQGAWDAFGTALTFRYGAIPAGMMMYRIRRTLNLLPNLQGATLDNKALELTNRMWFDPDIAVHVLRADPEEIGTPRWNWRLNKLLAAGEYARDEEPERRSLEITVGPPRERTIEETIMGE